jgi:polysaccharide deacetylase family protein (PEP-CTERM system associated)
MRIEGSDLRTGRRLLFPGGCAAITVDLEEWFHVCSRHSERGAPRASSTPSNVERASARLFDPLGRRNIRATIFVLGSVARTHPRLVKQLSALGHEIASHGESHERMDSLPLPARRSEIRGSRARLEDLTGRPVLGFRAAEWSIRRPTDPTLRILAEEGYLFDASESPVPPLGDRRNPPHPFRLEWSDGLSLAELPPLTGRFGGRRLPAGGSWIARLFPFPFVAGAIAESRDADGLSILTLHPWEFDPAHPVDRLPPVARFVHHGGLAKVEGRLADSLSVLPEPIRPLGECLADSGMGKPLAPFPPPSLR